MNARELVVVSKVSEHDSTATESGDISSRSAGDHTAINDSVGRRVAREGMELSGSDITKLNRQDVVFSQRIKSDSIDSVFLYSHSLLVILNHTPISPSTFISSLSELKLNNTINLSHFMLISLTLSAAAAPDLIKEFAFDVKLDISDIINDFQKKIIEAHQYSKSSNFT